MIFHCYFNFHFDFWLSLIFLLQFSCYPPWQLFIPFLFTLSSRGCLHHHLSEPPHSLGPQVSQGLGAPSPTEVRVCSFLWYRSRTSDQLMYVASYVSESSLGSGWVETASLSMGLATFSAFLAFPLFIHWAFWPQSNSLVEVSAFFSIRCLLGVIEKSQAKQLSVSTP